MSPPSTKQSQSEEQASAMTILNDVEMSTKTIRGTEAEALLKAYQQDSRHQVTHPPNIFRRYHIVDVEDLDAVKKYRKTVHEQKRKSSSEEEDFNYFTDGRMGKTEKPKKRKNDEKIEKIKKIEKNEKIANTENFEISENFENFEISENFENFEKSEDPKISQIPNGHGNSEPESGKISSDAMEESEEQNDLNKTKTVIESEEGDTGLDSFVYRSDSEFRRGGRNSVEEESELEQTKKSKVEKREKPKKEHSPVCKVLTSLNKAIDVATELLSENLVSNRQKQRIDGVKQQMLVHQQSCSSCAGRKDKEQYKRMKNEINEMKRMILALKFDKRTSNVQSSIASDAMVADEEGIWKRDMRVYRAMRRERRRIEQIFTGHLDGMGINEKLEKLGDIETQVSATNQNISAIKAEFDEIKNFFEEKMMSQEVQLEEKTISPGLHSSQDSRACQKTIFGEIERYQLPPTERGFGAKSAAGFYEGELAQNHSSPAELIPDGEGKWTGLFWTYKGKWKKGYLHGEGLVIDSTGHARKGVWHKGLVLSMEEF